MFHFTAICYEQEPFAERGISHCGKQDFYILKHSNILARVERNVVVDSVNKNDHKILSATVYYRVNHKM